MIVLVTGAAGLLGGALAAALAKAGHAVIGLVHREPDIRGNDGQRLAVSARDGSAPTPGKIIALNGDVRQTDLGLDVNTRAWLQKHVDVVVHCAALVKFEADEAELEAVNVEGTGRVARLLPQARFIQVSTAYVCGLLDGPVAEKPCDPNAAFGNSYERSKARAETVLREVRPDAIIARPSIIVGEESTGRIRSFDTIYRAFKFIAEGKIREVPVSPLATLNFVPIDYVVSGLCDLVEDKGAAAQIVHLVARRAISASHFLALIGRIPGLRTPEITSCDAPTSAPMGIAERLAQPYWGYFRRHPDFATDQLTLISGRAPPEMDDAAFLNQIRYCVEAGFIRADRKKGAIAPPVLTASMPVEDYRTSG